MSKKTQLHVDVYSIGTVPGYFGWGLNKAGAIMKGTKCLGGGERKMKIRSYLHVFSSVYCV